MKWRHPNLKQNAKIDPFCSKNIENGQFLTRNEIFPTLELNLEWFGHFKLSRGPRTPDESKTHVLFNDLRSKSVFLNEKNVNIIYIMKSGKRRFFGFSEFLAPKSLNIIAREAIISRLSFNFEKFDWRIWQGYSQHFPSQSKRGQNRLAGEIPKYFCPKIERFKRFVRFLRLFRLFQQSKGHYSDWK